MTIILFGLLTLSGFFNTRPRVSAATSGTLNFQMRLLTSSGNTVPDGNYHLEFKLYTSANSTGSSQGSCSGDANCLWTETRTTGNLVRVVGGYLSVNLGSVTAFPGTVNWDQEHWLGVRVGGSAGAAAWEAIELTSDGTATGNKMKLTAVPYAFVAGGLAGVNGANRATLGFTAPTANRTILLPDEGGTLCIQSSSNCGFAVSSGSGNYIQNTATVQTNANFAIQSAAAGNVGGLIRGAASQTADLLRLESSTPATVFSVSATGAVFSKNIVDSAVSFQIQNAAGAGILTVDNSAATVYVGSSSQSTTLNINGNIVFSGAGTRVIFGPDNHSLNIDTGNTNGTEDKINFIVDTDISAATNYQTIYSVQSNGIAFGTAADPMFIIGPDFRSLTIASGDINGSADEIKLRIDTDTTGGITSYADVLAVDSGNGGSIGIGTSGPTAKLQVDGTTLVRAGVATTFQVQNATGADAVFTVDTAGRSASGGNLVKIGNSTGTDTNTSILQLDSATANPTSNLSALNGGLFYNSTTNKVSIIENGAVKVLCNTTDLGCGGGGTTLQGAYDADADGSDAFIQLTADDDSIILRNPSSGGTDSGYVLTIDQLSTAARGGLSIQSAGTGNLLLVTDTTATARDVLTIADGGAATFRNQTDSTTAFQIQNAAGNNYVLLDTSGATLNLGNPGIASTVQIGNTTGAVTQTINLGNNATASSTTNINIGSTIAGATTLQSAGGVIASTDIRANASATGTTGTTTGSGTNTTTLNLTSDPFSVGDVVLIDNAGQDYYTRITVDPGTNSYTVSPAVTFETGRTVTKYTIQNIGATASDYSTPGNRFFQGYFLGGVVAGTGSTIYSDANISGTAGLKLQTASGASVQNSTDLATAFSVLNSAGTDTLLAVDTTARGAGGGNLVKIGNSTGTDTNTSILQLDSATANPTSNLSALNGGLFYNSTTNKVSIIENGAVKVLCNTTDLGCGGGGTTLQGAYDASSSPATISTTSVSKNIIFKAGSGNDSNNLFQVQNAAGFSLLNVDTTTNNLVNNGNFEANTTGWAAKGASTISQVGETAYYGNGSMKVVTPATASTGTSFNYTFQANTAYSLTAYVKMEEAFAVSVNNIVLGRQDQSGSDVDCANTVNVLSGGWTQVSCTFTTGPTISSSNLYLKQTDATARTFYVDAVQLTRFSELANASVEQAISGNWTAKGTPTTHAQTATQAYDGSNSLQVTTQAVANQGTQQSITLQTSTAYRLTFYVRSTSLSSQNVEAGYSSDGSTDNTPCSTKVEPRPANIWNRVSCTFTTPSSNSGTPYIYIKHTSATAVTFYFDAIQLTRGNPTDSFREGSISLNGTITSPAVFQSQNNSTNVFQVQDSLGAALFNIDSLNSTVSILGGSGDIGPWKYGSNVLPEVRYQHETVVLNGYLYVLGGADSIGATKDTVYYAQIKADGNIGGWGTTTALPVAKWQFGALAYNGYVYITGGRSGIGANQSHVYYAKQNADGTLGAWTATTSMPATRRYHEALIYNGYIYVLGGWSTSAQTNAWYAKINADGSLGKWNSSSNTLPVGTYHAAAAAANGYVYLTGGENTETNVYYSLIGADGNPGSWNSAASLPSTSALMNEHGAVVMNGYLYLLGGDGSATFGNVLYARLNSNGSLGSWSFSEHGIPGIRSGFGAAAAVNGYVYVIGGYDGTTTEYDTVLYTSGARLKVGANLDLVGFADLGLGDSAGAQGSLGGQLTAGNTRIIGSLAVQGQAVLSQGLAVNGNSLVNGDLVIGQAENNAPHSFAGTCNCLENATAGSFGSQSSINGVFSTAVYNGQLYAATKEADLAGVYRYDGSGNWTLVSDATPGKIIAADTANIDASVLTVYNGRLYAGTQTGSASGQGAIYAYDGSSWSLLLATRGTFGSDAGRDGVSALQVYNGKLYAFTQETDLAGVYRYDGSTTWTRISGAGQILSETADIDEGRMVAYGSNLWVGSATGNSTARIHRYDGNSFTLINTTAGTLSSGTTGVDDIRSMAVFNNQLFVGTRETDLANIYVFKGGYDGAAGADVFYKTTVTSGRVDSTNDATDVDSVPVLQVYNGRLYAGSETSGLAAVYEYSGTSTGSTNNWTLINSARGTFGAQSGLDSVNALSQFNGLLYLGTEDTASNNGSVYSWLKTSESSYSLGFNSGSGNTGGIRFIGNQQVSGNSFNTGSFVFTHGILSTAGAYDIAEDYPTRDTSLAAGDLVSIDKNEYGFVRKTALIGDSAVLGVYSEKPGLRLSQTDALIDGSSVVPIALAGRVPVKATDQNGPIAPGDFLTSSDKPGYAMKATNAGVVIGKALEPLAGGEGKITAFINISYYMPTLSLQGSDYTLIDYLSVSGTAKLNTLEVGAGAVVNGNLQLGSHLQTTGQTPSAEVMAADVMLTPGDLQLTVAGNDISGTVKISVGGAAPESLFGNIAKISFARPYEKVPKVFLQPGNPATQSLQLFREVTKEYFTILTLQPLKPGSTYQFDYLVVE